MTSIATVVVPLLALPAIFGQKPPEAGYCFPPGGNPGTVVRARLAGSDWTPDISLLSESPGVKIEALGAPGPVLLPEPPYWQGIRSFLNDPPLPREMEARISLPPGMAEGPVRWRVVNACGSKGVGTFWVDSARQVLEDTSRGVVTDAGTLPVTISGRLGLIGEVDRHRFVPARSGTVSVDILARRLGSDLNAVIEVRDAAGAVLAEAADTAGREASLRFRAETGKPLELSVRDIDYKGYRSLVYMARIRHVPEGAPMEAAHAEPGLITGTVDLPGCLGPDRREASYQVRCVKGEEIVAVALAADGLHADLYLRLVNDKGVVVGKGDDHGGGTDPRMPYLPKESGDLVLIVGDHSPVSSARKVPFRLVITKPRPGFRLEIPQVIQLPAGGDAALEVKAIRTGGFAGPIRLEFAGAPASVSFSGPLEIPAGAESLKVKAVAGKSAPATHALLRVSGTGESGGGVITAPGIAPHSGLGGAALPENGAPFTLCCVVVPPPFKGRVVEADGGRRVHRGATHLAEIALERNEGFTGELVLDMAGTQQRHRQGIRGPAVPVAPGVARVDYPVFLPEGLETSKTSRIGLVAMARVPDASGAPRWVLAPVEGQITMSIEGALMKLTAPAAEVAAVPGQPLKVVLRLTRGKGIEGPVVVSLADGPPGISGPEVSVPPGSEAFEVPLVVSPWVKSGGTLRFKASSKWRGHAVESEAEVSLELLMAPGAKAPPSNEPR